MQSLDIILEAYDGTLSQEDKHCYADKKNKIYRALLKNMSPDDLSPEVKNTLDQIRAAGIKMAVGSSSKNAKFILAQIGLDQYFDAVSDGNDISRSKPDPEVFLKAAEFLGVASACCMVVEDAVAGVHAAKAAHMDCAAIGDAAESDMADYRLAHFSDLLRIVF